MNDVNVAPKAYCIKDGYKPRNFIKHFDDTRNTDKYQRGVYEYALKVCNLFQYRRVIDFGCGSGYKLVHFFDKYDTLGIDLDVTVKWLREKYPDRAWATLEECGEEDLACDMLICADVIEHVLDPDLFCAELRKIQFRRAIISTPERDLYAGPEHMGPPSNSHHVREWNGREFCAYMSTQFRVVHHGLSGHHDQMVLVEKG